MKRNQLIIIAIAIFAGLWMYSQSAKASTANCEDIYSCQVSSDATVN